MTRFEFTESLRKALSGRVNHRVVNENVAYYEHYIDAEIKKGRSEEDVLGGLGDPRRKQRSGLRRNSVRADFPSACLAGFAGSGFAFYFDYKDRGPGDCDGAAVCHPCGSDLLSDTVFPAQALRAAP